MQIIIEECINGHRYAKLTHDQWCPYCLPELLNEARRSLEWTQEKPTKPGYYWVKDTSHKEMRPTICKVHRYDSDAQMVVRYLSNDGEDSLIEVCGLEWAGPILPPE